MLPTVSGVKKTDGAVDSTDIPVGRFAIKNWKQNDDKYCCMYVATIYDRV
jgi:hypothetical protein